jgi:hypothetical protein
MLVGDDPSPFQSRRLNRQRGLRGTRRARRRSDAAHRGKPGRMATSTIQRPAISSRAAIVVGLLTLTLVLVGVPSGRASEWNAKAICAAHVCRLRLRYCCRRIRRRSPAGTRRRGRQLGRGGRHRSRLGRGQESCRHAIRERRLACGRPLYGSGKSRSRPASKLARRLLCLPDRRTRAPLLRTHHHADRPEDGRIALLIAPTLLSPAPGQQRDAPTGVLD